MLVRIDFTFTGGIWTQAWTAKPSVLLLNAFVVTATKNTSLITLRRV
jgi:hypothetical protein